MATTTYTGSSLVDYLNSNGQDSSLTARASLAVAHGLVGSTSEYNNLAASGKNGDINTKLLDTLRSNASATVPTSNGTPGGGPTPQTGSTAGNAGAFNGSTMTATGMEKATNLPDPTTVVSNPTDPTTSLSDKVSALAGTTLDAARLAIDNLRATQQQQIEQQKQQEQAKVDQYTKNLDSIVGSTPAQDALKRINDQFKVQDSIQMYTDIQQKIVDAQQALNVGLIYEKDRPARMKFITGAESTLMKQGLATIGALQGTAAVIKGNIDMAKAYADSTISAINQDNTASFNALTTLLDLHNTKLIDLTSEEQKTINDRLGAIETQAATIEKNKNDVLDLMTNYPRAFLAGGVTLLDTKEQALKKMLPQMAADETAKFNAAIAADSTKTNKDGPAADKQQLLELKAKGMTYEEAVNAYGDTVSIDWINAVYNHTNQKPLTGTDAISNAYYSQFLNPDGTLKPGYTITPTKTTSGGAGPFDVTQTPQNNGGSGGWFSGITHAIGSFFGGG